jgi:hypothetical protein
MVCAQIEKFTIKHAGHIYFSLYGKPCSELNRVFILFL